MSLASSVHDIQSLILSFHPVIVIETTEEERLRTILQSVANQARLTFFEWSLTRGLTKAEQPDSLNRTTAQPLDALKHLDNLIVDGVFLLKDFARHLEDPMVARQFRETAQRFTHSRSALVLVSSKLDIPPQLESLVLRYPLSLPGPQELTEIVATVARSMNRGPRWDLKLPKEELQLLLAALKGLTLNQARQAVARAIVHNGRLDGNAAANIMDQKVATLREGGLLEYYPCTDNPYEIGGFQNLLKWLDRARMGFSPQAKAMGLTPPRGIMVVGVQGCGKSLSAKAIARAWSLPLLKLDMGSLYNKYMGETERNFRKALEMAESLAPCVLWLDEIEKALSTGAQSESDDGVSLRILGHFLTWLQEQDHGIFVVATANNISRLPPELMRKGRFDEIFFVDLPTAEERLAILKIHMDLRHQDSQSVDLDAIVQATEGFSGAELEQALIAALYRALHAQSSLCTQHITDEIAQTVPLSHSRREDLARLRASAEGRFVPV
ncbi:MAG: AAA family ATPase [Planctomycetota bacterium]|nr:AAA family ATPase [Planctomycetota bacterium]